MGIIETRVLSAFMGTERLAQCADLRPILGGQSSARLYQFEHGGQSLILRVLSQTITRDRREHEITLTQVAGLSGVGPRVRFIDKDACAIIYDYTSGETLRLADQDVLSIERLAQSFATLHGFDGEAPLAMTPPERFRGFMDRAQMAGVPWLSEMHAASQYIEELARELPDRPIRLCHLDSHLQNIVKTAEGELVLIDWVNGGLSDHIRRWV